MNNNEVYEKRDEILNELRIKTAEIHADVKNLVKSQDKHLNDDKDYQKKTDATLEDLKKFKWKQIGAVGGALAVLEIALKYVMK